MIALGRSANATDTADGPVTRVTHHPKDTDHRIEGVDAIRMFAAFGAAWLHTAQSPELAGTGEYGRFAVAVFNTIAAYFLVRSLRRDPDRPFGPYFKLRISKLYVPFLAWSVIYIAARLLKSAAFGKPLMPLRPGIVLEGPSHQLWYLPFVIICCAIGFPVAKWALKARERRWSVAIACVAICLAMSFTPMPAWIPKLSPVGLDYFGNRVWHRLPSFLSGFAMAMIVGHRTSAWDVVSFDKGHKRHIVGATCFVAGMLFVVFGVNFPKFDIDNLRFVSLEAAASATDRLIPVASACYTAAGLFLVASAFGGWANPATKMLSELRYYAFGIFLAHTLFIEGAQAILDHTAPNIAKTWPIDLCIYAFAITGSIAFTALIHSVRSLRWLIPA